MNYEIPIWIVLNCRGSRENDIPVSHDNTFDWNSTVNVWYYVWISTDDLQSQTRRSIMELPGVLTSIYDYLRFWHEVGHMTLERMGMISET